MRPYRVGALLLATLTILAAAPRDEDPEVLLRQGHAAFARGDHAAAADLYDRASLRCDDPGRAAACLAAARYRMALAAGGATRELQEAEALYRAASQEPGPRQAQALFGLGDCLLTRGGRDRAALRAALQCFGECRRLAEGELREDAAHNFERARLLLAQLPPEGGKRPDEEPAGNESSPPQPEQDNPAGTRGTDGEAGSDANPDRGADAAKAEPGSAPQKSDATPPPGAGTPPAPVPDRADVRPLSAHVAAEHLELAHRRVAQERRAHRRMSVHPAPPGVPAW
jgi:tetratricopeptide (TPR) repeat protein